MEMINKFIESFSSDKAKGYIMIVLFIMSLFGFLGWGKAIDFKGKLDELNETKCKGNYKYNPPDDIKRLYLP